MTEVVHFVGFVVPGAPEGSTGKLVFEVFWKNPGSNLRPLVHTVSDLSTAPLRRVSE